MHKNSDILTICDSSKDEDMGDGHQSNNLHVYMTLRIAGFEVFSQL